MHEGHRGRMRERFLREGSLDSFAPHEVLELLLYYAIPIRDVNGLAHELINHYGSLSSVLEADVADLTRMKGIGENSAVLLGMIPSLMRAYSLSKWGKRPQLQNQHQAGKYCTSLFIGRHYECFILVCLDAQKRVLQAPVVHEGTINESPLYPRLLVEVALRHKASAVILTHNHPGGSLRPSHADLSSTQSIKVALGAISIDVLDHIIVAENRYLSLVESRMMEEESEYEIVPEEDFLLCAEDEG